MKTKEGAIYYRNENIVGKSPADIIKAGISMSFIPEDRLGMGLVASMGMADNMLLKSYKRGKGPFWTKTVQGIGQGPDPKTRYFYTGHQYACAYALRRKCTKGFAGA